MTEEKLSPWGRFIRLLALERRDILQMFYYAIFSGLVGLSLPLGIQAIINLIQGAQISSSWIVLVVLVTLGVIFTGLLQLMQLRIIETIQQRIFVKASFELSYRFPKIQEEGKLHHFLHNVDIVHFPFHGPFQDKSQATLNHHHASDEPS